MSPEECTPIFSPQIYAIDNAELVDTEFPEVSFKLSKFLTVPPCSIGRNTPKA